MDLENKARKSQVTRRSFLLSGAAIGVAAAVLPAPGATANMNTSVKSDDIRPFRAAIPETALADLRRRLAATRWPDSATVKDRSQGVEQRTLQELVAYWQSAYDWRGRNESLTRFLNS